MLESSERQFHAAGHEERRTAIDRELKLLGVNVVEMWDDETLRGSAALKCYTYDQQQQQQQQQQKYTPKKINSTCELFIFQ
jgi:hypothetical protein